LKKKKIPAIIKGISKYILIGIKNARTVHIRLSPNIPVKMLPEIPPVREPKKFSMTSPQPASTERMRTEENKSSIIKKDCLKISNL
jgi:hypothetical protein